MTCLNRDEKNPDFLFGAVDLPLHTNQAEYASEVIAKRKNSYQHLNSVRGHALGVMYYLFPYVKKDDLDVFLNKKDDAFPFDQAGSFIALFDKRIEKKLLHHVENKLFDDSSEKVTLPIYQAVLLSKCSLDMDSDVFFRKLAKSPYEKTKFTFVQQNLEPKLNSILKNRVIKQSICAITEFSKGFPYHLDTMIDNNDNVLGGHDDKYKNEVRKDISIKFINQITRHITGNSGGSAHDLTDVAVYASWLKKMPKDFNESKKLFIEIFTNKYLHKNKDAYSLLTPAIIGSPDEDFQDELGKAKLTLLNRYKNIVLKDFNC